MLLSSTVNKGMFQLLDRFSGSTTNTYPFKDKTTDLNDALDWYFRIAFETDRKWSFDDINQTSPPIDTQNIVSGTNRYKVSAFTEKILDLIRLEVLNSSGKGVMVFPETFDTLGMPITGNASGIVPGVAGNTFQELYLNAPGGTPTNYTKYGDFIYLRPNPNYSYAAGLKAYFNRPALKFNFITFTVTSATPAVFTSVAHGLVAGDTVILETDGALYTGLGVDTQYYVISTGLTADAFELSLTAGGTALNTSGSQSGTHCFLKTNASPGINSDHHMMLCRKASQAYLNFNNSFKLGSLPQEILQDEEAIKKYFSQRHQDLPNNISPIYEDNS